MSSPDTGDGTESGSTSDRDPASDPDSTAASGVVEEATGIGVTTTLLTGVLLAFAYYGTLGVAEDGFGSAIPAPFYLLAVALLFVLELARLRSLDARGLARAVAVTAVYGTLTVLALEGAAFLWREPEAALEGYAGVAVLAVAIVLAALAYVVYLAAKART